MCRFRVRGAGYGVNEDHVACRVRAKNPDETGCLTGGVENFLIGAVTEQKEGRKRAFFLKPVRLWCVQRLSFLEPWAYQIRRSLHHVRTIYGIFF